MKIKTLISRLLPPIALVAVAAIGIAGSSGHSPRGRSEQISGTTFMGQVGVTETVAQIMARENANPTPEGPRRLFIGNPENETPPPVISAVDPDSKRVAQWPASETQGRLLIKPPPGRFSPQTIGTSFNGVGLNEGQAVPPDSMGGVGPTQVLFCENLYIKVFTRSGSLGALHTSTDNFFASVEGGQGSSDPMVRYDRLSQRWFVTMVTVSNQNNRVMLAVSSGPTINNGTSFTFFSFSGTLASGDAGRFADYPSLGIDANALYMGCNMFNGNLHMSVFVITKSSVLSTGPIHVTAFGNVANFSGTEGPYSPRGVDNDDPAASEGYFLGPSTAFLGRLAMLRVNNPGGTTPTISHLTVSTPSTTQLAVDPRPIGSNNTLATIDWRCFQARIFYDKGTNARSLWTAHNIEVNSSGVAQSGGGITGSRWYQIDSLSGSPTLVQSGTLFNNNSSLHYWMPSVAMSTQGHMAISSSVGGSGRHADIATAGRLNTDPLGTIQSPTFATSTSSPYNVQNGSPQRWGDYSASMVDPNDGMSIWTFQEYCNVTNSWAVRVVQLLAPPPATITGLSPNTLSQGQTMNVTVNASSTNGSGFFDPDNTYPNHISAAFSGSGVTVNSIIVNSPTQLTLNVSVSGGAATGPRDLTVTNPDGQSTTGVSVLTIVAGGQQEIDPSAYTITHGTYQSGQLSDVYAVDGNYLVVQSFPAPTPLLPELSIEFTGTSPISNPSSFQYLLDSHVNTPGVTEKIELFDYQANAWVEVASAAATNGSDSLLTGVGTNPARFVQSGTNQVKTRVSYKATGNTISILWLASLNQAVWNVSP